MIQFLCKITNNLLIIISLVILCNLSAIYAAGNDKDVEEIVGDKSRLLYSKIKSGDYSHVGNVASVNLVINKALNASFDIKNGNTLDIGCGLGGAANFLKQQEFKNIYGIDVDKEAIHHANDTYPGIVFQALDALEIADSFDDDFFSFVYMLNTAHVIERKIPLVQQIKAICKTGAILVIFDCTLGKNNKEDHFQDVYGKTIKPLNAQAMLTTLKLLGWEIIETTNISKDYKSWYKHILESIEFRGDMFRAIDFSDAELKLAYKNFAHLISLIDSQKLGGVIIIARKI